MDQRKTYTIINPATEEAVGSLPVMEKEEIHAVVRKARSAQKEWERIGLKKRLAILKACSREIEKHADAIALTVQKETGKPFGLARVDPLGISGRLDYLVANAAGILSDEKFDFGPKLKGVIEHRARGVVAVICPWNFPLAIAAGMFGPALAAGNTVVVKPSKSTPFCMLEVEKHFARAGMPDGVFQVITGTGQAGAHLVEADINMVSFTGSSQIGQEIKTALKNRLIPVALELGGKDPYIVMGKVDIERVAQNCVDMAVSNNGQACCSVERVYVDEAIADRFIATLLEKIRAIKTAETNPDDYEIGPFTTEAQMKTVIGQVEDAVKQGARILHGGKRIARKGYFFQPTLVVDVNHSMRLMREETFGPVIPVMRVKTDEEAIALANDCEFGLSASVWCKNKKRALAISSRLEAGTVWVNTPWAFDNQMPWGGVKNSGFGRIMSKYGLLECCEIYAKYYGS